MRHVLSLALVLAFALPADACCRRHGRQATAAGYQQPTYTYTYYPQQQVTYAPPTDVTSSPQSPAVVTPTPPVVPIPTPNPTPPIPTPGELTGNNPNPPNTPEYHWWEFWKKRMTREHRTGANPPATYVNP